jgi:transposase
MNKLENLLNEIKNVKLTPIKYQSLIIDELIDNLEIIICKNKREIKQERDNKIFNGTDKYNFWKQFNKKVVRNVKELPQDIINNIFSYLPPNKIAILDLFEKNIKKSQDIEIYTEQLKNLSKYYEIDEEHMERLKQGLLKKS